MFNRPKEKILSYKFRSDQQGTMKDWKGTNIKNFEIFWDYVTRCKNNPKLVGRQCTIMWCVVKIEDEDFFRYYHVNNWGNGWRKIPLDSDYNFAGDYQAPIDKFKA